MTLDLQDLIARLQAIEKHAHNTEVILVWDDDSKENIENYEYTFDSHDVFTVSEVECRNNVTRIKISCL